MWITAETLNDWATEWSSLMIAMLWQSTVLAAIVGVVALALRRASPTVRYWLWQIVAIKLLILPLWTVSVTLPWLPSTTETPLTATTAPGVPAAESAPTDTFGSAADITTPNAAARLPATTRSISSTQTLSWPAWLMIAWAMGVLIQITVIVRQRARLGQLLGRASPGGPTLSALVANTTANLGLTRVPRVMLTNDECSPFVCGLIRPVIVLPQSIGSLFPTEELRAVIAHELAHVKRLDLLWSWTAQLARMLYFFHPVAHWAAFHIRLEAEVACDGWAMKATGQPPGGYANLLVRVVGRLSEPAVLRAGAATSAGLDGRSPLEHQA